MRVRSGWYPIAGTAIGELVGPARAEATAIRRAVMDREQDGTRARSRTGSSIGDALTRVSLALAEDPELLSVADLLIRMPWPARRAFADLLSNLARRS